MNETEHTTLQDLASQFLIRHRSILDINSRLIDLTGRISRTLSNAVTSCGCVRINASRQRVPSGLGLGLEDMRGFLSTHLDGELCAQCREQLEGEIGTNLFYLAALCHVTGLDLEAIMRKERDRVSALGVYHLT